MKWCAHSSGARLLSSSASSVLLVEALHAAFGIDQLHLAREERVAIAADINRNLFMKAAGFKLVATGTGDDAWAVLWMNLFFHRRSVSTPSRSWLQ